MYEVKPDKALDRFTVGEVGNSNFLVVCESEHSAKLLCTQITMQMIQGPIENVSLYTELGTHPNGFTQLYQLDKKK